MNIEERNFNETNFADWLSNKLGKRIGEVLGSGTQGVIFDMGYNVLKISNKPFNDIESILNKNIEGIAKVYAHGSIQVPPQFLKPEDGFGGQKTKVVDVGGNNIKPLKDNNGQLYYLIMEKLYDGDDVAWDLNMIEQSIERYYWKKGEKSIDVFEILKNASSDIDFIRSLYNHVKEDLSQQKADLMIEWSISLKNIAQFFNWKDAHVYQFAQNQKGQLVAFDFDNPVDKVSNFTKHMVAENEAPQIKITDEMRDFVQKFDTDEQLLRSGGFDIDILDRAAFGFSEDDVKTINPRDLRVRWFNDLENVKQEIRDSGIGEAEWAKQVDLSEPIDVDYWEDHKLNFKRGFYIQDGHHRYTAALIISQPLNVNLQIKVNPMGVLAPNMGYDDFHREVFRQVKGGLNEVIHEMVQFKLESFIDADGNLQGFQSREDDVNEFLLQWNMFCEEMEGEEIDGFELQSDGDSLNWVRYDGEYMFDSEYFPYPDYKPELVFTLYRMGEDGDWRKINTESVKAPEEFVESSSPDEPWSFLIDKTIKYVEYITDHGFLLGIHESVKKKINEDQEKNQFDSNYFINRIPFLKDFEVQYAPDDFVHERMPQIVKMVYTKEVKDVTVAHPDQMITFPKVVVIGEFYYYPHKAHGWDYTIHNLNVKCSISLFDDPNIDKLTNKVMQAAMGMQMEQISSSNEVLVYDEEDFHSNKWDEAINDANRALYQLEEFIQSWGLGDLNENLNEGSRSAREYYFSTDNWDYIVEVHDNEANPDFPYFGFKAKKKSLPDFSYDMDVVTNDNIYEVIIHVSDILKEDREKHNVEGYSISTFQNKKGSQRIAFYKKILQRDGWNIESDPSGYPNHLVISEGYNDVDLEYVKNKKKLSDYSFDKIKEFSNFTLIQIPVSDEMIVGKILAFDNGDQTEIANADYGREHKWSDLVVAVDIRPDWRRKKVATEIYKFIEELMGDKISPDLPHSDSASKFWAQPNRPFGKLKEFDSTKIYHGHKIPTEDVFQHPNIHKDSYNSELTKHIDVYRSDEEFEQNPVEWVDVNQIVPTQKFLTKDNLEQVKNEIKIGDNTGAYLVKFERLYYVIDGHHRIASQMIDGVDKIKAFVQEV